LISIGETLFRLIISAIAGGIIGAEREATDRPAGLRTHVLVTLGSALIMLISMYGFNDNFQSNNADPARLAAQVVSGIGFLGAGTILRTGTNVMGLTTAASIWICGGIGLAFGNGYYVGGISTTIIVFFTLRVLGSLESRFFKKKYKLLTVQCRDRVGLIGDIGQILAKNNITIRDIKVINYDSDDEEDFMVEIKFYIKVPAKLIHASLIDEILQVKGVEEVKFEGYSKRHKCKSYNI